MLEVCHWECSVTPLSLQAPGRPAPKAEHTEHWAQAKVWECCLKSAARLRDPCALHFQTCFAVSGPLTLTQLALPTRPYFILHATANLSTHAHFSPDADRQKPWQRSLWERPAEPRGWSGPIGPDPLTCCRWRHNLDKSMRWRLVLSSSGQSEEKSQRSSLSDQCKHPGHWAESWREAHHSHRSLEFQHLALVFHSHFTRCTLMVKKKGLRYWNCDLDWRRANRQASSAEWKTVGVTLMLNSHSLFVQLETISVPKKCPIAD